LSLKLIRLLVARSDTRYMKYECRTHLTLTGCTEYLSRLLSDHGSTVAQEDYIRRDIPRQPPFLGTR